MTGLYRDNGKENGNYNLGFKVCRLELGVQGLGFRAWARGCRLQGLGYWVLGAEGFGVYG